jgi:hypothetical protein
MDTQVYDPIADSLGGSSLGAALPFLSLFLLLGVLGCGPRARAGSSPSLVYLQSTFDLSWLVV